MKNNTKLFVGFMMLFASNFIWGQLDTTFIAYNNSFIDERFRIKLYNDSTIYFFDFSRSAAERDTSGFILREIVDLELHNRLFELSTKLRGIPDPIESCSRVGHLEGHGYWSMSLFNKCGAVTWSKLSFYNHFDQYRYTYTDEFLSLLSELSELAKQLRSR